MYFIQRRSPIVIQTSIRQMRTKSNPKYLNDNASLYLYFINNSKRSDECIDFTMMFFVFFVFVSVYNITSRNNSSISNIRGDFRWKSEYPWCIIQVKSKHFPTVFKNLEKNKKKSDGKTGIFTQNQFSTKSIFLYGCNSKTNHCKYFKFSPNIYRNDNDLSLNDIIQKHSKLNVNKIRQNHEYLQIILLIDRFHSESFFVYNMNSNLTYSIDQRLEVRFIMMVKNKKFTNTFLSYRNKAKINHRKTIRLGFKRYQDLLKAASVLD
ncbi:hypothetical protein AGLY_014273 [Aphis glycines]|uniref:Uncharacterized protein n=1 Tax=Aphis glycines TaxID=307491 RepID=A0A6G0T400_APHGL|nr:hypothetical protein AGLY_014273 [Aphis glycines]